MTKVWKNMQNAPGCKRTLNLEIFTHYRNDNKSEHGGSQVEGHHRHHHREHRRQQYTVNLGDSEDQTLHVHVHLDGKDGHGKTR